MTRLGETIKKARLGAKMTEKALAKKCGVAESFIKEVEAGRRIVSDDQAQRILNNCFLLLLVLSAVLTLLFLLTIYLSVVVIFTGDWFFHLLETHLPHPLLRLIPLSALSSLWLWIRYLLLFCFVLLLVLAIYRLGTPRRFRSSRKLLLSSLFTAVSLVAGSLLFSWFIGLSSRYSMLYGSLASLIILLVWLYFCGNVLLLGALLSRVLEVRRARHHSTGS